MPVVKPQPDRLTRVTTKRDGQEGRVVVAEGTPLARLQSVKDDPDTGVLAGDLNDVLAQCDPKDEVIAKLAKVAKLGDKLKKGDRIVVATDEVEYVTALLVGNHERSLAMAV
jgi:hypothetical protein